MNEHDLEERLRSVTEGPQPSAPATLRRFLRDLPEAQAARRGRPLGWLRGIGGGVRGLIGLAPARPAWAVAAVSIALIVGLAVSGLIVGVRQAQVASSASGLGSGMPPTQEPTPVRSHSAAPSPLVVVPAYDMGVKWVGVPYAGNENQALPTSAVIWPSGGYVGISTAPYGQNGLVYSDEGLYWDWHPASEVAPAVQLTSIAADGMGRVVVVGGSQGIDGTMDGRVYVSEAGGAWQPVADESVFRGTPVQVVVRSPAGWVALGWNDTTPAGSVRPVTEWFSRDGLTWQRPEEPLPIKGTSAYLLATPQGFILSGVPLKSGAPNELPIWRSEDGQTWQRSVSGDNSAQKLGPLVSAAINRNGLLLGVSQIGDGMSTALVWSIHQGKDWSLVPVKSGVADPSAFSAVAAMSTSSGPFIAVNSSSKRLYMSDDAGVTWKETRGEAGLYPLGQKLVTLGDLTQTEDIRVLSFGPDYKLPIWLAVSGSM
jgi:hypothetical protein